MDRGCIQGLLEAAELGARFGKRLRRQEDWLGGESTKDQAKVWIARCTPVTVIQGSRRHNFSKRLLCHGQTLRVGHSVPLTATTPFSACPSGKWEALSEAAGFDASPKARPVRLGLLLPAAGRFLPLGGSSAQGQKRWRMLPVPVGSGICPSTRRFESATNPVSCTFS